MESQIDTGLLIELQMYLAAQLGVAKYDMEKDIENGLGTMYAAPKIAEVTNLLNKVKTALKG